MTKQAIIDVPLSHIPNPGSLIQEIRDVHAFEPNERAEALATFVLGTETDLDINLGALAKQAAERALSESPESQEVKVSLFPAEKPNGDSIRLTVDDQGQVLNAMTVEQVPVDSAALARDEKLSRDAPSGPKRNNSSFRTNPKNI